MSRLSAEAEKLARDAIHNRKRLQVESALALVGAERVSLIPEAKLPLFIEAMQPTVDEVLRGTTADGLLTAYKVLTHRLHADRTRDDLRVERNLIEGELLRRLGGRHTIG